MVEAEMADAAPAAAAGATTTTTTTPAPAFDLEAYIAPYSAPAKLDRLLWIAEQSAGTPLELEALKLAGDDVKKSLLEEFNVLRYHEVMARIDGRLGPDYMLDEELAAAAEREAAARQARIEAELSGAKANLVKEGVRAAQMALGWFHFGRGDMQSAFKCFVRARDVCSTPRHVTEMCLACVRAAAAMGQWAHVPPYVARAEQAAGAAAQAAQAQAQQQHHQAQQQAAGGGGGGGVGPGGGGGGASGGPAALARQAAERAAAQALDASSAAALRAAAGLAQLDGRRYREAARTLSDLGGGLGPSAGGAGGGAGSDDAGGGGGGAGASSPAVVDLEAAVSGIASGADLALYAALTSLATLDRAELRRRCVDGTRFREVLEMHPVARDLLLDFCDARYAPALARLSDLERHWAPLDPLLKPHARALAAAVRQRAAVQFARPYSRVSLVAMARALGGADPARLKGELAGLVAEGLIPGMRLDLSSAPLAAAAAAASSDDEQGGGGGALVARERDARREAVSAVLGAADAFARDVKAALLRASVLRHDMLLRTGAGGGGGGGGGGGFGPGGGGGGGGGTPGGGGPGGPGGPGGSGGGPRGARRSDRRHHHHHHYPSEREAFFAAGGGGGGYFPVGGSFDEDGGGAQQAAMIGGGAAAGGSGGGAGAGGGGGRTRASSRRGAGGA